MSSPDEVPPEETTAPSAEEITDPALQAEIANPAESNPPTGASATPGDPTTAADRGPLPAPGAPGELSSDEAVPTAPAAEEEPDGGAAEQAAPPAGGEAD
ncbi:MAG: hypothetical protein ACRDZ9_08030, partial [Acidimicrobiales bacterium]